MEKQTPYATKHGETDAYWLSDQANFSCKVSIEQAISAHYRDNRLDTASAVQEILEEFGAERMNFILANTIQHKDADGRISRDNKAWAKTIPMPEDSATSQQCADLIVDRVNPGLVDLFTRQGYCFCGARDFGGIWSRADELYSRQYDSA